MELFTEAQRAQLIANGKESALRECDHVPVVKLFTPDAGGTWLLTEIHPENPDKAYGLCDLGLGFPERGYVSLKELLEVRGAIGLPIQRDDFFTPKKPLSAYAAEAIAAGRISTL